MQENVVQVYFAIFSIAVADPTPQKKFGLRKLYGNHLCNNYILMCTHLSQTVISGLQTAVLN